MDLDHGCRSELQWFDNRIIQTIADCGKSELNIALARGRVSRLEIEFQIVVLFHCVSFFKSWFGQMDRGERNSSLVSFSFEH